MTVAGGVRSAGRGDEVRYVDRREIFAGHWLFQGLAPDAIAALVARTRLQRARRGKTIFRKGSEGTAMMAVLQGSVKICVASAKGREAVLNIIGAGQVFGEIALLDGGPRTADAVAQTDCDLLVLERRDLLPVLRANPDMALRIMAVLCRRLRRTSEQVEDAFFLDLPQRLAKTLLRLAAESAQEGGAPADDDAAIAITQRQLGEITGASRESVNKQMKAWEAAGLIRLAKAHVEVVDPAALRRVASSDGDNGKI